MKETAEEEKKNENEITKEKIKIREFELVRARRKPSALL